jgi:hypothetical protein
MTNFFSRNLIAKFPDGKFQNFQIKISCPKKIDDEYYCVVNSGGILSDIDLKSYGNDEIDAVEYAIHLLDVLIFERDNNFEILWPDKSTYCRTKILDYRWSVK